MVGNNEAGSDDDAHAQHTHTPTSDDDVLSHSPARVCRAKADAIASGEATVGDKLREELGDLLSVLRGVDVFKALSDVDLSKIADSLLRCVIPAGEIVMRQGERSSTFYLIVRGTATVARSDTLPALESTAAAPATPSATAPAAARGPDRAGRGRVAGAAATRRVPVAHTKVASVVGGARSSPGAEAVCGCGDIENVVTFGKVGLF